jgi:hypothetical protein
MKNFNAHQLGGRRCRKEQHVFFPAPDPALINMLKILYKVHIDYKKQNAPSWSYFETAV